MIKIKMKRYDRIVELQLPTEYEHVMVCLWKLGLERDPAKYTLRDLNAVNSYDTPWEHQIIRLVSIGNTLEDALMHLQRMMSPPYPIAARLRAGILSGTYRSGMSFVTDMEKLVENEAVYEAVLFFPLSGELVDARGNVTSAPAEMLAAYEQMIASALCRVQLQALHSETYLFSDVDGFYQKLLSAQWGVELVGDQLVGKVVFLLTEEITEEEAADTADKIEMINSLEFAIRVKQWSVLTDRGLLFIYLCDKSGNYGIIPPDELEEYEEDVPCRCPACQERLRGNPGTVLDQEEMVVSFQ